MGIKSVVKNQRIVSIRRPVVILLAGLLVGMTVGSGVSVFAAPSTTSIMMCANKRTNMVRYAKNGVCRKTEIKVLLTPGSSSDSGAPSGPAGATGPSGPAGATGSTGPAGADGSTAIVQQSICGVSGTSLCKIGTVGPGGGTIFFVDYYDQYSDFNYLESAPIGWANLVAVQDGEVEGTLTVDPQLKWCDVSTGTPTDLLLKTWDKSAVGSGVSNSAAVAAACDSGAAQLAEDFTSSVGAKSDWFLPSLGEAMLMYANLRQSGLGNFFTDDYWASNEFSGDDAWRQDFVNGYQYNVGKTMVAYVRPVRRF